MRLVPVILLGLVTMVPWVFEQITFQYYLHGPELTFFAYSGTRMPFFIMVEVSLGAMIGFSIRDSSFALYILIGISAVMLFTFLAYQLCDSRACYYSGPDRLGEVRFFAVLASGFVTGAVIGNIRYQIHPRQVQRVSNEKAMKHLLSFYWAVPFFTGSYASALLYNVPSEPAFTIFLFICFLAVSFLLTGLSVALFIGSRVTKVILFSIASQLALFFLFRDWSTVTEANDGQSTVIQLALILTATVIASTIGHALGNRLGSASKLADARRRILTAKELSLLVISVLIFTSFGLFDSHPGVYAPVDMLPRHIQSIHYEHRNLLSGAPDPLYYSGAFNTGNYFASKRIEATFILNTTGSKESANKDSLQFVGMGAQSPNCCKDGLDYGYRADIARVGISEYFLVARAWETCDQNAACSGVPWQSTMHESETPITVGTRANISLAMAWDEVGRKSVQWYYRLNNTQNWTEFSSFDVPKIENPYFDLGVADVGNFATNFPSGNANFFQVGLASQSDAGLHADKISINCPAFYKNGTKYCFSNMQVISDGDSHWKVWWQWGLSRTTSDIRVGQLPTPKGCGLVPASATRLRVSTGVTSSCCMSRLSDFIPR